jgi:hypothetical protein
LVQADGRGYLVLVLGQNVTRCHRWQRVAERPRARLLEELRVRRRLAGARVPVLAGAVQQYWGDPNARHTLLHATAPVATDVTRAARRGTRRSGLPHTGGNHNALRAVGDSRLLMASRHGLVKQRRESASHGYWAVATLTLHGSRWATVARWRVTSGPIVVDWPQQ